jgi:hypothetical protein
VFLDDDYNVIVDATPEYDLYEALLDYKSGDAQYADDRNTVFANYGILQGDGSLNFSIRGKNFSVTSTRSRLVMWYL